MKNKKHILNLALCIFIVFSFVTTTYAQTTVDGLIHLWSGEENANDGVGNANGTSFGTTQYTEGLKGSAFYFDGRQSSIVRFPVDISANNMWQMTMGMLINVKDVPTGCLGWVMGHDDGGYDRSLIIHDYRYGNGLASGVGHTYPSTLPQLRDNIGRWYGIAVAFNYETKIAIVYINDLEGTSDVQNVTIDLRYGRTGAPNVTIGGLEHFINHTVNAIVDETFIFDRTLSEAELDQVFADLTVVNVVIDIMPGSDENPINLKSKGVIPVAILTTDGFDATIVDPATILFGPNEATIAHKDGHFEDVDEDGDIDLVLHFKIQETGLEIGDTEACLTGNTTTGIEINGCDNVTIKGKLKKENSDIAGEENPHEYTLSQNFPNPFNPTTTISYSLPESGYVNLTVYNSLGQPVEVLVDGAKSAGHYSVNFNGANLSSGLYIYKLYTNQLVLTRKLILMK